MTRWETYCDGRRPDKGKLVQGILKRVHRSEVCDELLLGGEDLRKDLMKLRIETLAVLENCIELVREENTTNGDTE